MTIGRKLSIFLVVFIAVLFLGSSHARAADPDKKDIKINGVVEAESADLTKKVVKNPHGFLEYDGTGYRVVTRDVKPDKASQVRLRPVTSKEHGTVYILEVIDEKGKNTEDSKKSDQPARLAVERIENLDPKGSQPQPRQQRESDVGVGLKVSETSEVLLGRGLVVDQRNEKSAESRDDGWRFRFKTNF